MSPTKSASSHPTLNPVLWYSFLVFMTLLYLPKLPDPAQLPRTIVLGVFNIVLVIQAFLLIKEKEIKIHWGILAALGWVIYLGFLIPTSINGVEAFTEFFRYGIAVCFLLLAHVLIEKSILTKTLITRGFLLVATLMIAYAFAQIIPLIGKRGFFVNVVEVHSFAGNKNLLSATLALCLPFLFFLKKIEKNWIQKVSQYAFWGGILLIALLHTRSIWLGAVLALFIGLPFFLNWSKNSEDQVFKPLVFAAAVVLFLGILGASYPTMSDTTNLNHRLRFWENSLLMLQDNPLGVGAGNWKVWFPKYGIDAMDATVTDGETTIAEPHNDYLWILAESGIPGFVLQVIFMLAVVLTLFKNTAKNKGYNKLLFIMAMMGSIAFLTFSFFDFPMERPELQMLFFLVGALSLSGCTVQGKSLSINKYVLFIPLIYSIYGSYVMYQKYEGEKVSSEVMQANARKDALQIVPLAQKAESDYFIVDRYGNPMPYYEGLGYMARGMEAECFAAFNRALEFSPYSIITLNQLGNYHKRRKEYDKAMEFYDRALVISPHYTAGLLNKSEVFALQGRHREALRPLNEIYFYRWEDPAHASKAVFLMATTLRALRDGAETPPGIQNFFSKINPELAKNDAFLAREYNMYRKQRAEEIRREKRGI